MSRSITSSVLFPLLLSATVLFGSCKKDAAQEEPTIDFGPGIGFQYRDLSNYFKGGDPTDWIADGAWNDHEKQLFSGLSLSLDATSQGGIWECGTFPNPVIAATQRPSFTIYIKPNHPAPTNARLAYVVVDKHYKELIRGDVAAEINSVIPLQTTALTAGELHRMYVVCYVPGRQVYYRTHGDIKAE